MSEALAADLANVAITSSIQTNAAHILSLLDDLRKLGVTRELPIPQIAVGML